jgi:hypothetical protein
MVLPSLTDARNAVFYFASIAIAMFFFVMAITYILLTISVNAGRISHLALIEAAIQTSAAQLAKNPAPDDVPFIRLALSDLNNQRTIQKKDIDYGQKQFHSKTFRECALAFNADCFHRNSSAMNTIYLGLASGILGACLFFFVSVRNDAITDNPSMWRLGTLISLICLLPIGAIIGLLTLFLL